jgi:hypothetical protein
MTNSIGAWFSWFDRFGKLRLFSAIHQLINPDGRLASGSSGKSAA